MFPSAPRVAATHALLLSVHFLPRIGCWSPVILADVPSRFDCFSLVGAPFDEYTSQVLGHLFLFLAKSTYGTTKCQVSEYWRDVSKGAALVEIRATRGVTLNRWWWNLLQDSNDGPRQLATCSG